jgi:hypothetical protein
MSASPVSPTSPKRRWLLKTALAVAAVGGAVGSGIWWRRGFDDGHLTKDGRLVLRALASAIVGPMLPKETGPRAATLENYLVKVESAIGHLPPAKRQLLGLLLGALANAPTRYLASGMWTSWESATDAQVLQALEHLRTAGSDAQSTIFAASRGITCLMFFSTPDNWALAGYPGPTDI